MVCTQDNDPKYMRSLAGLSKLACLFFSLVGALCILCSSVRMSNFRGSFYLVVCLLGFLVTLALLLAAYMRLWQRRFCNSDANSWALHTHAVLATAYFLASGLVLSLDVGSYTAAAFFSLTVFSFNVMEALIHYRRSRQCDVATQTV